MADGEIRNERGYTAAAGLCSDYISLLTIPPFYSISSPLAMKTKRIPAGPPFFVFLILSGVLMFLAGCATTPLETNFEGEPIFYRLYEADLISKPREIPKTKGYPLLPPDMNYRYFEGISRFPFEPHAQGYNSANAWILADAAFLAYTHPGFARMAWELAGFEGFHFIYGDNMECMVAWNDTAVIISFRGTELNSFSTLAELATDLDAFQVSFSSKAYVHKGFLEAFESIWLGDDGLKEFLRQLRSLDPLRPVWITGHSLGGALAQICFAELPVAAGCYVYGAPRVGNREFAAMFEDRTLVRFEYGKDPITQIPIDIPSLGFGYADAGMYMYITKSGEVVDPFLSINSGQQYIDLEKRRKGIKLEDHMPINYAVSLWNALLQSK